MTRKELQDLGLEKDQINEIMSLNGRDIEAKKTENETLQTSNENLTKQLADRDKDLEELQKSAGENSELQTQFNDLQAKYKDIEKTHASELLAIKKDNALNIALTSEYGAKNVKAVKALLNSDSINLDENGALIGLKEAIEPVMKENDFLFNQKDTGNKKPSYSTEDVTHDNNPPSSEQAFQSEMFARLGLDDK